MIVKLPNGGEYNSQLTYEEQSAECKQYFNDYIGIHEADVIEKDNYNRPKYVYYDDSTSNIQVKLTNHYQFQNDPRWTLNSTDIELILAYIWHLPNERYQIKGTDEQYNDLLEQQPEFGVYRKAMGIEVFKEPNMRYMYVNYFETGHREMLESYGIVIIDKTEI